MSWSGTTCVPTGGGDGDGDGGDGDGDGGNDGGGNSGGGNDGGGDGDGDGDGDGNGEGDGDGDGNGGSGNGNGDGEGEGACDPKTDPNKCGESSVGGEDCEAKESCSGDAIQCAIFRQQKAQRCADEEFRKVDQKAISDLRSTLDSEFSGQQYQPLEATSANTFDLSGMIDTSSRFSKSCPAVADFSIPWLDGRTRTVSLSDVVSDLCTLLTFMGYFVVAFAMRRAAEIIALGMN